MQELLNSKVKPSVSDEAAILRRPASLFPTHLGRYEIMRRLGVGGMAETFEGLARGPGGFEQKVCIKCVLPAYVQEARFCELFMTEARITASLHHANIVKVIDFGEDDPSKLLYMALELVEGTDLRLLLRDQPDKILPYDLVMLIALELTRALEYAHGKFQGEGASGRRGVIHRDISPSNVLLSSSGEVKLTDFGIAKEIEDKERTLTTTGFKGKLVYMSPEHLKGKRLDGRSDLFSLGIVLYECLAGRRPFDRDDDFRTATSLVAGMRSPLDELCDAEVPREFLEIPDPTELNISRGE